jgi:hypothetical protein
MKAGLSFGAALKRLWFSERPASAALLVNQRNHERRILRCNSDGGPSGIVTIAKAISA